MTFTIIDQYNSFVSNNFIKKNEDQIKTLNDAYANWIKFNKSSFIYKKKKKNGVYVYGKTGTGKTFLLNLICQFTKESKKIQISKIYI